jgi:hypothetical protein
VDACPTTHSAIACKCGVHATREGCVRSGRHWLKKKRVQSAPSQRLPPTTRLGAPGRALGRKPHNSLPLMGPRLLFLGVPIIGISLLESGWFRV